MGIKREYQSLSPGVPKYSRNAELSQIIHEHAPDAVKTGEIKNHFGRKVAIVCYLRWLSCTLLTSQDAYVRSSSITVVFWLSSMLVP